MGFATERIDCAVVVAGRCVCTWVAGWVTRVVGLVTCVGAFGACARGFGAAGFGAGVVTADLPAGASGPVVGARSVGACSFGPTAASESGPSPEAWGHMVPFMPGMWSAIAGPAGRNTAPAVNNAIAHDRRPRRDRGCTAYCENEVIALPSSGASRPPSGGRPYCACCRSEAPRAPL